MWTASSISLSIRNVAAGIGVLQGWYPWTELQFAATDHPPVERFRPQGRDLYIPAGGVGIWQGALRDSAQEEHAGIASAFAERRPFTLDLLYSDHVGDQRTISRFSFIPVEGDDWMCAVSRHWHLDSAGPRSEIQRRPWQPSVG
jgi:hypothetical protein